MNIAKKHIWLIICGDRRLSTGGNKMHDALDDYLALRGYEVVYMTRVFGPEVSITDPDVRTFWEKESSRAVSVGHCEETEIIGHLDCGVFLSKTDGLGLDPSLEAPKHQELGQEAATIIAALAGIPTKYVLQDNIHFIENQEALA